jgi:hypothetical protein
VADEHPLQHQTRSLLAVLGGIASASSVVSLIQHIGDITLFSVFHMYIKLYRDIIHPIVGFLPSLFHIRAPLILKDLWALSAISAAVTRRVSIQQAREAVAREFKESPKFAPAENRSRGSVQSGKGHEQSNGKIVLILDATDIVFRSYTLLGLISIPKAIYVALYLEYAIHAHGLEIAVRDMATVRYDEKEQRYVELPKRAESLYTQTTVLGKYYKLILLQLVILILASIIFFVLNAFVGYGLSR